MVLGDGGRRRHSHAVRQRALLLNMIRVTHEQRRYLVQGDLKRVEQTNRLLGALLEAQNALNEEATEAEGASEEDVAELLRREDVGALASKVSAWPMVRMALRELQLSFRRPPGLVADGRDMGTVIFPDAELKVFLTASAATRAERRHKQLISKGIPANIDSLRADLEARDARDQTRSVSPLKPAEDAMLLDNSALSIEASVAFVLDAWQHRRSFA